jgi:hypothetical protein
VPCPQHVERMCDRLWITIMKVCMVRSGSLHVARPAGGGGPQTRLTSKG